MMGCCHVVEPGKDYDYPQVHLYAKTEFMYP